MITHDKLRQPPLRASKKEPGPERRPRRVIKGLPLKALQSFGEVRRCKLSAANHSYRTPFRSLSGGAASRRWPTRYRKGVAFRGRRSRRRGPRVTPSRLSNFRVPDGQNQYLPSILPFIRESIRELDVLEPTVLVDAGACRIGSGVRTIIVRVPPLGRFGPATPAAPLADVPRPLPPASAVEPQARVAMINVVAVSRNAICGNPMPKALSPRHKTDT